MARTSRTELDDRGQQFCIEMAKGAASAYHAAIAANFTESTARCKASGWLKLPLYIAEINRLRGIVGTVIDEELKAPSKKKKGKAPPPPVDADPETPDIDAQMRAHAKRIAEAAAAVDISKEWVLRSLVANHERATAGAKPNLAAANQALSLIGIELGMFVRRQHIEYEDVTKLSPDEQKAELEKALAEMGDTITPELRAFFLSQAGAQLQ
jgi:hypothetical protein